MGVGAKSAFLHAFLWRTCKVQKLNSKFSFLLQVAGSPEFSLTILADGP